MERIVADFFILFRTQIGLIGPIYTGFYFLALLNSVRRTHSLKKNIRMALNPLKLLEKKNSFTLRVRKRTERREQQNICEGRIFVVYLRGKGVTMSQSLSKIYVHLVFSTKNRIEYFKEEDQPKIFQYIASVFNEKKCTSIRVGGTSNHIHALFIISKTISLSDIVCKVKSDSSKWIKTLDNWYLNFEWQKGYGAFSVSYDRIETVNNYIKNQKQHHEQKDFKEELLKILKDTDTEYDEKYLWD